MAERDPRLLDADMLAWVLSAVGGVAPTAAESLRAHITALSEQRDAALAAVAAFAGVVTLASGPHPDGGDLCSEPENPVSPNPGEQTGE